MTNSLESLAEKRREMVATLTTVMVDDLVLDLAPEDIDPDASLFGTGLQLDSIDAVELTVCIERAFNIKLSDNFNIYSIRTVNKIVDAIIFAQQK